MRTFACSAPWLVLLLSLLFAAPALAQDGGDAADDAAEADDDDDDAPRASDYLAKVQDAIRLTRNRDFEGAGEALRQAFREEPSNPIAFYFAGEINRMQEDFALALERFESCAQFAERANNALYRGLCLRGKADTLERIPDRLGDARSAWAAYVQFADQNRNVTQPEVGRARMQAIDRQQEQAGNYIAVRNRIAAREAENAESGEGEGGGNGNRRRGGG